MRKIIFCLLILLLAACSNKKTPPEAEGEATKDAEVYVAEIEEEEDLYAWEDEDDTVPVEEIYGYSYLHILLIPSYFLVAQASSELPGYPAENLLSRSWRSWSEGAPGNGIGESFTISWDYEGSRSSMVKDDAATAVAGFALKNGYGNLNHYGQNNRVKSFKIYADGKYIETIPIKDSIGFEQYIFTEPVAFEKLRFVIDDVYPGTEFNDTCVAEIVLLRRPINDTQFYKNILFWFDSGDDGPGYYHNHDWEIASVSDPDRLLLLDYLPFVNNFYYFSEGVRGEAIKTKIALLGGASSLRLSENLPRLDGATAMYPLYSSFVRAVYPPIYIDWGEEIYYNVSYRRALYRWPYHPNLELLLGGHSVSGIGIDDEEEEFGSIVQCNKTSRAFQRLIDGEADIIFCYEPSEAEINAAAEKGKRFNLTPIAYDAFVFIVNEKNSLNNITQRQIRDIYSGRVTNWKAISGVDEPVIAYQRPENSGSQTTLQSIMQGRRLMRPILDAEYIPTGMFGMLNKVSSDYYNYNSAIGYTFMFYLTQMAGGSGVKTLALDGVAPTRQTIQNKTYPFVQTVYAITTGNESENTKKFIEWILSAQGQELVVKTGYTPIR